MIIATAATIVALAGIGAMLFFSRDKLAFDAAICLAMLLIIALMVFRFLHY